MNEGHVFIIYIFLIHVEGDADGIAHGKLQNEESLMSLGLMEFD